MARLHLVNPCKFWLERGKITAYQSHDILENSHVTKSLEEAIEGMDLTIGTTAQHRDTRKDAFDARALPEAIRGSLGKEGGKVALVFGSEASGLSTEDLKCCDWVSHIPLTCTYPSLNLSHAVMIYAYECAQLVLDFENGPAATERTSSLKALKEKSDEVLQWLEVKEHAALHQRIKDRLLKIPVTDQKLLLSLYRFFKRKM